jgi:hypothetical protein
MDLAFESLIEHKIPIDKFQLKWRFTEEKYDKLPQKDLNNLIPLNSESSKFLWNYLSNEKIHFDDPLNKNIFRKIKQIGIQIDNEKEVKAWLSNLGIPLSAFVLLNWDQDNSMIVPMKILIKYYDSFFYPSSDDLTVFDKTLNWILLFRHDEQIFFGVT